MSRKSTRIKVVVVGDSDCGKTSLLSVYANDYFPKIHEITVFDTFIKDTLVGGVPVHLALWDTAGQEYLDRLRPLSYPDTDILLLVFSIDKPESLTNVLKKWYPEINSHCPGTPIILVGTKKDLRTQPKTNNAKVSKTEQIPLDSKSGKKVSQQIGAAAYMECSSKNNDGVREIFETAARFGLLGKKNSRWCSIL